MRLPPTCADAGEGANQARPRTTRAATAQGARHVEDRVLLMLMVIYLSLAGFDTVGARAE